ncbi:RNA polymerase sigma factor [Paenibacillus sp. FJAT-26967]|uniref:RNA polymerase sigma factor n=1 Tax=Paenibacillus sp. FJAT-26967 TaxID=1729690 RepID=UPI0020A5E164|nr:sigma-70 family RNA polymerase sigma factor [Paenibacillus sp. FJAT-26967]
MHDLAPGYDRDQVLADLMAEYGEDVWNFAYFLTRKSHAADDISQDVFLIVYNRLYTFRGESTVKSWLLSITRNKSLNYLKTAFIRKVILVDVLTNRPESSPSPETVVFDRIASKELWDCVIQLPLKFREVILLHYHYGLPNKEIALLLKISEGTVKSRMYRAKNKLSAMLAEQREEE